MLARTMVKTILNVSKSFPVILLTGSRQVGKTTLLLSCSSKERNYVTLDDLEQRQLARNDPKLFIELNGTPVFIDEIQYAPELFNYIKIHVDKYKRPGDFWLTGSQKFQLMDNISESLAGRVAILDMLGLSQREIKNYDINDTTEFIPSMNNLRSNSIDINIEELYRIIWTGSFPQLVSDKNMPKDIFYSSYIKTYIERDIKDVLGISDNIRFYNFIRATAARTGQLLNYNNLARDVDIDPKTAKAWLSVLEKSCLIKLLEPYHNNIIKRVVKSPKLYFLDTGLCSFLTGWSTPTVLMNGAMNGAILETYVFSEIIKSYYNNGKTPQIYFYRDTNQREIDFIIEKDDTLYPIEVKKTLMPSTRNTSSLSVLKELKRNIGIKTILCPIDKTFFISKDTIALPIGLI